MGQGRVSDAFLEYSRPLLVIGLVVTSLGAIGHIADAEITAADRLIGESTGSSTVSPGGEISARVTIRVDSNTQRLSIAERFSPAFESVTIDDVGSVTGQWAGTPVIASTSDDGLVVVVENVSAGTHLVVEYTVRVPDDASDGTRYFFNGTASTESRTEVITGDNELVVEAGSDAAPDVTGNGEPATDPDGDGRYEDVDGDGGFDRVDVEAFERHFNSSAVQDNPRLFDFNEDGVLNVGDIRALESELGGSTTNEKPVARFDYSPSDPETGEGVVFDAGDSYDPDGTITRYEWDYNDDGVFEESGERLGLKFSEAGSYPITLRVTDDQGATTTTTRTVTVGGGNGAPDADAGADVRVGEETRVRLNGTGSSDPDGDRLRYEWTQLRGPSVRLRDANTATPTFVAPAVETRTTLVFELRVADGNGGSDTDTVRVTVTRTNRAPRANAGTDRSVVEQDRVTLDGTGSDDPDGDSLSYSWRQIEGPSVELQDADTATPEFTAPGVSSETTLVFELRVADGNGGTDADTVRVTVTPRSGSLRVAADDRSAVAGRAIPVSFEVRNAGDQAAERVTLTIEKLPDSWTVIETTNAGGTWQPDRSRWVWEVLESGAVRTPTVTVSVPASAEGEYTIRATASQSTTSGGPSATATVTVSKPANLDIGARSETTYPSGQTRVTIVLENTGQQPSRNPVVDLDTPPGWSVVGSSNGPGTVRTTSAEWQLSSLAPGDAVRRTILLRVPQNTSTGSHNIDVRAVDTNGSRASATVTVRVEFRRGFFRNNAESPIEFLTNVGNLTLIGFVLSIAGILLELRRGI